MSEVALVQQRIAESSAILVQSDIRLFTCPPNRGDKIHSFYVAHLHETKSYQLKLECIWLTSLSGGGRTLFEWGTGFDHGDHSQ